MKRNKMNNRELARTITTTSLVTRQQGSWKYQNAFAVNDYYAHLTDDGRIVWRLLYHGQKMSDPQIRRSGIHFDNIGRMIGKPVPRKTACKAIGGPGVKRLESHGWKFQA